MGYFSSSSTLLFSLDSNKIYCPRKRGNSTGPEALKYLSANQKPRAILCDLQMPVFSGAEFFRQLQDRHESYLDTFIFMSGGAFTTEMQEFLADNSRPLLMKSFGLRDFEEILEEF